MGQESSVERRGGEVGGKNKEKIRTAFAVFLWKRLNNRWLKVDGIKSETKDAQNGSWLVPSGPGWLDDGPFMFLVMVSGDLWRLFDLEENAAGIAERGFHDAAFTIRQNQDLKRFPAAERKKERIFVNELRLQKYRL